MAAKSISEGTHVSRIPFHSSALHPALYDVRVIPRRFRPGGRILAGSTHRIHSRMERGAFSRWPSESPRLLEQNFGREPTSDEIADELGISSQEVTNALNISSRHLSLDKPFNDGEDNKLLDVIYDKYQPASDEIAMENSLNWEVDKTLSTLTDREAEVIRLYFGINIDNPLTLEEIGKIFKLTRERVRQIKEKALNRLRHQSRSRILKTYYDDLASEY